MKLILIYAALILCCILLVWAFSKLLKAWYNLKALSYEKKHPGSLPRSCGLVFNKKTGKLEADSRPLLPFE